MTSPGGFQRTLAIATVATIALSACSGGHPKANHSSPGTTSTTIPAPTSTSAPTATTSTTAGSPPTPVSTPVRTIGTGTPPTTGAAVVEPDPDPCSSPNAQWVPENAFVGLGYLDARIAFDPPVAVQGQKVQFLLTISNRHLVAVTNADENGYFDNWMLSLRRKQWSGDTSLARFLLPCPQELVFPAHASVTYRGEINTAGMRAGTLGIYVERRDDSWNFLERIDGRGRPAGTFTILAAEPTTTITTTTTG